MNTLTKCLSVLVVFGSTFVSAEYSISELALPSGITNITPTDINNNNEVVGWAYVPNNTPGLTHITSTVGMYWSAQGQNFILDNGGDASSSKAYAINNNGNAVGEIVTRIDPVQGFFRSNQQSINLIGDFTRYSKAVDINDDDLLIGNVVGLDSAYPSRSRAFRVYTDTSMEYIDEQATFYPTNIITGIEASEAYKINNDGKILNKLWGTTENGIALGPISAIMLKHATTNVEQLRNTTWHPNNINNNGIMIVGDDNSNQCFGFEYETNTGTTLAIPDFNLTGVCIPNMINNSNTIVGEFEFISGERSAFIFDGEMKNLNQEIVSCGENIVLTSAISMNENGVILAEGYRDSDDTTSVTRAYLLFPTANGSTNCNRGDLNNDNLVDVADVMIAERILLGLITPTTLQTTNLDLAPVVNGEPQPDGEINAADVLILERKVLGKTTF
jgi:uncharacterized membrane protein